MRGDSVKLVVVTHCHLRSDENKTLQSNPGGQAEVCLQRCDWAHFSTWYKSRVRVRPERDGSQTWLYKWYLHWADFQVEIRTDHQIQLCKWTEANNILRGCKNWWLSSPCGSKQWVRVWLLRFTEKDTLLLDLTNNITVYGPLHQAGWLADSTTVRGQV